MCLIIDKPAGETISRDVVDSALSYNPDGVGYLVVTDGGIAECAKFVWRVTDLQSDRVATVEDILDKWTEARVIIHFRMATDGAVTQALSHPFGTADGGYLFHNGVLGQFRTDPNSNQSDTTRFRDEWLNPRLLDGSLTTAAIEACIKGSRIVLVSASGDVRRYGSTWHKHEGSYYSNLYAWDTPGQMLGYVDPYGPAAHGGYRGQFDLYDIAEPHYTDDCYSERLEAVLCHVEACLSAFESDELFDLAWSYMTEEDLELYSDWLSGYCSQASLVTGLSPNAALAIADLGASIKPHKAARAAR